jgi:AcrR family transcriptional regulator
MRARSPIESSRSDATRRRVLESACYLFSAGGLQGTHVRDVGDRAGVNTAVLYYHFRSKEGLYKAVIRETARQLTAAAAEAGSGPANKGPEARLCSIVESLLQKLGEKGAWIARVLAHELAAPTGDAGSALATGAGGYSVHLRGAIGEMLGAEADRQSVRLCTVSVVGQCVACCLAAKNHRRAFRPLLTPLPAREKLARHIVSLSLGTLRRPYYAQPR